MFNVRLAGDYLYGKQLFTWLSLVVSLMASFCAVLFPTRCLELIESVSGDFLPTLPHFHILCQGLLWFFTATYILANGTTCFIYYVSANLLDE